MRKAISGHRRSSVVTGAPLLVHLMREAISGHRRSSVVTGAPLLVHLLLVLEFLQQLRLLLLPPCSLLLLLGLLA
jgi:predicted metal-dependent phosphotriesterase family hydrolase